MLNIALAALLGINGAAAFAPTRRSGCSVAFAARSAPAAAGSKFCARSPHLRFVNTWSPLSALPKDKEKDGDKDKREGMEDAFASLDALSSLDFDEDEDDAPIGRGVAGGLGTATPEEAKLYTEMYDELDREGEDVMYSNILGDLGGSGVAAPASSDKKAEKSLPVSQAKEEKVLDDADGIGSTSSVGESTLTTSDVAKESLLADPDMEDFMERAVTEALKDVKSRSPEQIAAAAEKALQDDEEMRKEINRVFEEANKKLLEGIKEIREEQDALSQATADARKESMLGEQERLAEAESSVSQLVEKVAQETAEVEKAVADLREAQEKMNNDPIGAAVNLKGAGFVKQGAFVGALLFTVRSLTDAALMFGSNGESHATAAAVQGALALACAAYFFFIK